MKNKSKFDKEQFIITLMYLIIALALLTISFYKFIKYKTFETATIETTILFVISLAFVIYKSLKDKKYKVTTLKGEELPTSDKKKDKNKRIKTYLIESIVFSVLVVALDLIAMLFFENKNYILIFNNVSKTLNIVLNSLVTFGICMLISFGLEYFIGELQSKRANRGKK